MRFKSDCKYLRSTSMGQANLRPAQGSRYQRQAYYCLKGRFDTRMRRGSGARGDLCGKCPDYEKKR